MTRTNCRRTRYRRSVRQMSLLDGAFFRKVDFKYDGQKVYKLQYTSKWKIRDTHYRDGLKWQTAKRIGR